MTLEQIAKQAMDYLDSVGVAAEYNNQKDKVFVITDDFLFILGEEQEDPIGIIISAYPQKSPA